LFQTSQGKRTVQTIEDAPLCKSLFAQIGNRHLIRQFAYVNGRWLESNTPASFPVTDPADGSWLGDVAKLSASQSAEAVACADRAFEPWASLLPQERAAYLMKWHDLILENREDLAVIMTREQGKPRSESRGEIDYAASFVSFYAEERNARISRGVTSHLPRRRGRGVARAGRRRGPGSRRGTSPPP
jgi:aspartate-semialdehyde dehydrogenase